MFEESFCLLPVYLLLPQIESLQACFSLKQLFHRGLLGIGHKISHKGQLVRLGFTLFFTLYFTKRYWQIPLILMSLERNVPFHLVWFTRIRNTLFSVVQNSCRTPSIVCLQTVYAAAYLDDIFINSNAWQQHMQFLNAVLWLMRWTGLTANLKCITGQMKVQYVCFH